MKRILVIGDVMVDIDQRFSSRRTSGEGVPVVGQPQSTYRLGGAGAVATMVRGLGAEAYLFGALGKDGTAHDEIAVNLARGEGLKFHFCLIDHRPTTLKQRIFVDDQQLFRQDAESLEPIGIDELTELQKGLPAEVDVVLVSDYGKGVVTPALMRLITGYYKCPIIVDPACDADWEKYRGASCLTPNREEAGDHDIDAWVKTLGLQAIVLKRDRDGLLAFRTDTWEQLSVTSKCNFPNDVCGAGDMVLAAMGVAIAEGAPWLAAARFANEAAAVKCTKRGAVPVTREEISAYIPF